MPKIKLEGIVVIGWLLLAIGILLDDFTTFVLFQMGFGVLETNPIYQLAPNGYVYALIIAIFFLLVMFCFHLIVSLHRKLYVNRFKYIKIYELLVFLYCFMIIFIMVFKIGLGFNNLSTMVEYQTEEGKEKWNKAIENMSEQKKKNPEQYKKAAVKDYFEGVKISYHTMILILVGTFLFFRVGFRVVPSDLD